MLSGAHTAIPNFYLHDREKSRARTTPTLAFWWLALAGVQMELQDLAYPLIASVVCTDDPAVAFKGADYAIFLGAFPRKEVLTLTHTHPIRLMTDIIRLMSPSHTP